MGNCQEKFTLFWLDEHVHSSGHNRKINNQLCKIKPNFEAFDDLLLCKKAIQAFPTDQRLILVVSGRFGSVMVPQIYNVEHLSAIYVYCMDKEGNRQWADQYTKIKDVINKEDELLDRIESDTISRVKDFKNVSFNIYGRPVDPKRSATVELQEYFIQTLALIDILLRLDVSSKYDTEFRSQCTREFKKFKTQSRMMTNFDAYMEKKALWCYLHHTTLRKFIHNALSTQDIQQMLSCHSIIQSINEQLKQSRHRTFNRVYFGQIMTSYEIGYLQKSVNGLFSTTTFLLTDENEDRARQKLQESLSHPRSDTERYYNVFFIVNIDENARVSKPFGAIDKIAGFIPEGEVLFMIGSIFRLTEVQDTETEVLVKLDLCSEDEPHIQQIFEEMRRHIGASSEVGKIDLQAFADIIRRWGKLDSAESIYVKLIGDLQGLPLKELYKTLATISKDKNEHVESVQRFEKALETQKKTEPHNWMEIASLNDWLGNAHFRNKSFSQALKYHKEARNYFRQERSENHPRMANINSNIGSDYKEKSDYTDALKYFLRALEIYARNPSNNPTNVAKTHNEIAIVYSRLNRYDDALEHFKRSIDIRRQGNPRDDDTALASIYRNMGELYERMNDLPQALLHYKDAYDIYLRSIIPNQAILHELHRKMYAITPRL
ncbi:unnamed protein product [Adineta ricciae]|uniref:Uncharacterized protein n=1 Tax=Adineta ricciae TaxID=249248 RepID=A0A815BIF3_ADIRI|nr:unnamed protein product [Adineta ricciae]CAF1267961.1 unnamed protein product [Adineta ricciae]